MRLRTPLFDWHCAAAARMVPFAGWDMPVYYRSINAEVNAVRQRSGLFDVSHMGRLELSGPGSEDLLQLLTVNDVSKLEDKEGHYSLMLLPSGGVIDDLIVYRRSEEEFLLVVNASNRARMTQWIIEHSPPSVRLNDTTEDGALIALQGPATNRITAELGTSNLPPRFHFVGGKIAGIPCEISRTGYTGEDGIEMIVERQQATRLWQSLIDAGAVSCGLGSRDTLRLEAAYCLYGHELSEQVNPLEAGLSWVVKWQKQDFVGKEALQQVRDAGAARKLVGLNMHVRSVPRAGQAVCAGGIEIGAVTSGTFSPTLQRSIAMAFVSPQAGPPGTIVDVISQERARVGQICKLPFYRSAVLKA